MYQQIISHEESDAQRLADPKVNMVVLREGPFDALKACQIRKLVASEAFVSASCRASVRILLRGVFTKELSDQIVRYKLNEIIYGLDIIASDVVRTFKIYARIMKEWPKVEGCRIDVRLEVGQSETPVFHTDFPRAGPGKIRLLQVLHGPGTEWTSNANVRLERKDWLAIDRNAVQQALPGDVLLFKGGPDGAFHRAPARTKSVDGRRLLIVIDSLK